MESYSLRNLLQCEEFLLHLTKTIKKEIEELELAREEVKQQQHEAQKQGQLVKKMTQYMSDELARIEDNVNSKSSEDNPISINLEKMIETEKKLGTLRSKLSEFTDNSDTDSLKMVDSQFSNELQKYETFLMELTNLLNQKISNLEKIKTRISAEKKESQLQKILLKDMIDLFNSEMEDLEQTFGTLKQK